MMSPEETFVEENVTYSVAIGGRFIVVEQVPARVSLRTGEQFFSPETVERLQRLASGQSVPKRLIQTPVFDRSQLSFADEYEARMPAIREELRAVLTASEGIEPFHYDLTAEQREAMTRGAAWDAYFFDRDGVRLQDHHAACPETSATLAQLPLDHIRDHGPEVCFSIMRPGAHILPHRGVTNIRSVLHLGLVIPDRCALNLVEVGEVHWQEGRCFAFDDTYAHEAWNRSDTTRVILLADIWNPHLSEAECAAVAELIAAIGDLNQATTAPM